ncbi:MAG: preprotein translocase subunit YajC [Clostridiales bacterium]|nr:preprotein translocase subunit YajC [Clostridiales bacterium]
MNYFLMTTPDATATGEAPGTLESLLPMLLMLGLVMLVMYFLTIRPQKKRDKALKAQIDKMSVGDKILTIGGVVGTVANIKDDEVTITTSIANTMVTFRKTAISTVTKRDSEER